jgi:uncharacterized protein
MTPLDFVFATLLSAAGSCVQASVGFGLGLLSAPLLGLIDPSFVPGPVIFASLPLSVLVAVRERSELELGELGWAMTGRIPGTIVGAATVALLPASAMGLLFAALVLVAVGLSMSGWHLAPTKRTLVVAGTASGFMGTTTSIGGPPVALVYQHATGPRLRSALASYFALGAAFSLLSLAVAGEFGRHELALGVALWPGIALGFLVSRFVARHLDRGKTRTVVLATSSLAAVAVIIKSLLEL